MVSFFIFFNFAIRGERRRRVGLADAVAAAPATALFEPPRFPNATFFFFHATFCGCVIN